MTIAGDERVLEAWVLKGYRVAATTNKLVVSERGKKTPKEVPYDSIRRVDSKVRTDWRLLAVGAVASVALVAIWALQFPVEVAFRGWVAASTSAYLSGRGVLLLVGIVPFLPIVLFGAAFLLTASRGYLVTYGASNEVFLPREFARALRFADELTLRSLFPPEMLA